MKRRPTLRQLMARFHAANEGTKEHIRRALQSALRDLEEFGSDYYRDWNTGGSEKLLADFQLVFGKPKPRA